MPIVYHGSPNKFTAFDYSHIQDHATSEGHGFYFTDNKTIAEGYAGESGYLYTAMFHGKRSLSSDSLTITKGECRRFLKTLDRAACVLSNWGDAFVEGYPRVLTKAVNGEYDSSNSDVDLIAGLVNESDDVETVLRTCANVLHRDHIKVKAEWGNQTLYIALVPEAFELLSVAPRDQKILVKEG